MINHDNTPINLSEKDKAQSEKTISEIISQLSFLKTTLSTADNATVHTHLSLLEYGLRDLAELTGYSSAMVQQLENRSKELREKNTRIHDLMTQLGKGVTADAVTGALRHYENICRTWYEAAGWYYGSLEYTVQGIFVTLSCDTYWEDEPHLGTYMDLYYNLKHHVPRLSNGTYMEKEPGSDKLRILDTDHNKKNIQLILSIFPNAVIRSFESHYDCNQLILRTTCFIPYRDLEQLYQKYTLKEEN